MPVAPSLQFVIGVFVYHESLPPLKLAGFAWIWGGLALFARDASRQTKAE